MFRFMPHRRWLRFTLRGLLVATLILCVCLAYIVNRARLYRNIIAELERCDANPIFAAEFNHEGERTELQDIELFLGETISLWIAEHFGAEYIYPTVVGAEFDKDHPPTVAAIQALAKTRGFRAISFSTANTSPNVLAEIKSHSDIDWLEITDASDDSLAHATGLPNLRTLQLDGSFTSLLQLRQLKHLTILDISSGTLWQDSLSHISFIQSLQRLGLNGVGNCDLAPLAQLKNLRLLDLKVFTNDASLQKLRKQLPDLESIVARPPNICVHQPSENELARINGN